MQMNQPSAVKKAFDALGAPVYDGRLVKSRQEILARKLGLKRIPNFVQEDNDYSRVINSCA